jgi:hypothetical protein
VAIDERRLPSERRDLRLAVRGRVHNECNVGRGEVGGPLRYKLLLEAYRNAIRPTAGELLDDTPARAIIAAQRIAAAGEHHPHALNPA